MFEYTVIRSNRKTLSIIIERDRSVVVRSPQDLSDKQIAEEVKKRKRLIESKINSNQKYKTEPSPKEFVSGEQFLFLGKFYSLEVEESDCVKIEFDNVFHVSARNKVVVKHLLVEWYQGKALELLTPRIKYYAENIGVKCKHIHITNAQYTWGTCTPGGNLNFNWRLIKAPIEVIDYIVVHELAHLKIPNHSSEFWNIVAVQLPNYEEAKNWLKEFGYVLEENI